MTKGLSLDEVVELAKRVDHWEFNSEYYYGFDNGEGGDPAAYIVVEEVSRFLRRPSHRVLVHRIGEMLADYTNPKVKEIYSLAKRSYEEGELGDKKAGLS